MKLILPISILCFLILAATTAGADSGLFRISEYNNASVFSSEAGSVSMSDGSLNVCLNAADNNGYRDVYLYYPMSGSFEVASLDYELYAGNKSNVLLFDFAPSMPDVNKSKGGLGDNAIVGIGIWSSAYGDIGGLRPLPAGHHHLEVISYQDELLMKIDGKFVMSAPCHYNKYFIVHLMTGDGDSYLKGSIANLTIREKVFSSTQDETPVNAPRVPGSESENSSGTGDIVSIFLEQKNDSIRGHVTRPVSAIGLYAAIAASLGFFAACIFTYFRYLRD